ncbi:DeoR family transcriptional regulator [Bifidobacterium lemurum]|uniref:DeoR family transcriptional regulator n=1 Tax=Bifidobacterium lemurum TaxID=1603886 RepID=A0A261FSL8_9BIFI|nr:diacylglycerol kinase family protein [Bifidobacterium lemurum]OZG62068.1 DeoR family transcriptional regulator [Bifidobacterium lemurum]QOL34897.1 diacylglycerol kinase [Bifidobacterium lemurum]
MSEVRNRSHVVGLVGNPTSDKGRGAKATEQVFELLTQAGTEHGFGCLELTGDSFDASLANARERADEYDSLVVVGGDGMIALGANAVGDSGKPLGIVAMGSGNDFARGLKLPVNRIETAVEGIVGAIVRGCTIDVDMGHVLGLADGSIDRFYAGMLSCGLDASINDRANHSRLPNGSVRYFVAVLVELTRMKRYGYHIKATLADGSVDERDIVTPLLTVANSRHIGGGIEVSPYSRFSDGMLDLVWMDHVPNLGECAVAISNAYNGRLLASKVFGWERVRDVEVTRADEGDEPPVLMADGEYVGRLPVRVTVCDRALRMLVPPAVKADEESQTNADVLDMILRDGRDPMSGRFA